MTWPPSAMYTRFVKFRNLSETVINSLNWSSWTLKIHFRWTNKCLPMKWMILYSSMGLHHHALIMAVYIRDWLKLFMAQMCCLSTLTQITENKQTATATTKPIKPQYSQNGPLTPLARFLPHLRATQCVKRCYVFHLTSCPFNNLSVDYYNYNTTKD